MLAGSYESATRWYGYSSVDRACGSRAQWQSYFRSAQQTSRAQTTIDCNEAAIKGGRRAIPVRPLRAHRSAVAVYPQESIGEHAGRPVHHTVEVVQFDGVTNIKIAMSEKLGHFTLCEEYDTWTTVYGMLGHSQATKTACAMR